MKKSFWHFDIKYKLHSIHLTRSGIITGKQYNLASRGLQWAYSRGWERLPCRRLGRGRPCRGSRSGRSSRHSLIPLSTDGSSCNQFPFLPPVPPYRPTAPPAVPPGKFAQKNVWEKSGKCNTISFPGFLRPKCSRIFGAVVCMQYVYIYIYIYMTGRVSMYGVGRGSIEVELSHWSIPICHQLAATKKLSGCVWRNCNFNPELRSLANYMEHLFLFPVTLV